MFVKAIEIATKFTRPFKSISRCYGSTEVQPGCATFIIVNDEGWVLTCKHVAEQIQIAENVLKQYSSFKAELDTLSKTDGHYKSRVKALEKKYQYDKKKNILIQQRNHFTDVVDRMSGFEWHYHPKYDVALIHLIGFEKIHCDQYPVFASNASALKQGMSLCRLGYPYPEFDNFRYNDNKDDIEWTNTGRINSPLFPIDGILTRHCIDEGKVVGIEMSTPGLRGQSGGPLFDVNGIVWGMQSATITLPLGFDQENREIYVNGIKKKVNDYSFIHLGRCIHVDVIKDFMDTHGVKYNVG
jgi:hypothetical protein